MTVSLIILPYKRAMFHMLELLDPNVFSKLKASPAIGSKKRLSGSAYIGPREP